jgi:hypothetical protein
LKLMGDRTRVLHVVDNDLTNFVSYILSNSI